MNNRQYARWRHRWRSFRHWLRGGVAVDASPNAAMAAEQIFGFRAAGIGRLAIVLALAAYTPIGFPLQTQSYVLLALAAFAAISALQMLVADRLWFRRGGKYGFIVLDVVAIFLVVLFRNPFMDNLWTMVQAFRLEYFLLFFVYLGSIALTNAPALVLLVGGLLSTAWLVTTVVIMQQPNVLTWFDLPGGPLSDPQVALRLYLDPAFFDISARLLEALTLFGLAVLLAVAAWHGRRNFQRFTEAEAERRQARETFSRYVPEQVARELLAHDGMLAPERREASILFVDIEGFTSTSEAADPTLVLDLLNGYFDAVGEVVGANGGIVTQFQGDGLLATFSPPLAEPNPPAAAARAAFAIHRLVGDRAFAGMPLKVRIGIATGPVVAGTLGGRARLSYTVIGDTVNLAQRLEELNKSYGTRTLVCERTVAGLDGLLELRPVGRTAVRGRLGEIDVFEPLARADAAD